MKQKVYFIPTSDPVDDNSASEQLGRLIQSRDLFNIISERDMTAVKTHFGEGAKTGQDSPHRSERGKAAGDRSRPQSRPDCERAEPLQRGRPAA